MSVPLPHALSEWNFETIESLVTGHSYEAGFFDFKEVLNATVAADRANHNKSIVRTACAMANSAGGFIIFGVRNAQAAGESPTDRIVGIPIDTEHRADLGRKLAAIQPPLYFDVVPAPIPVQSTNGNGVFIAKFSLSPRRPHMVREEGVFYRRGEGGTAEKMDFYQVRDQMLLSEERLQQVTLVRLRIIQWQQLCEDLLQRDAAALLEHYGRFETAGFENQLATICSILPSDTEFLKELLALSTDAQMLNRTMERWHFDDFLGHRIRSRDQPQFEAWQHEIHGKATMFLDRCNAVEAKLQEHFDSILPASNLDAGAAEAGDDREQ